MNLTVLFFSTLREITGVEEMTLALEDGEAITVADVLERLYLRYPKLRQWEGRVLLALDQSYVDGEEIVEDGQELAIMPPVQGG